MLPQELRTPQIKTKAPWELPAALEPVPAIQAQVEPMAQPKPPKQPDKPKLSLKAVLDILTDQGALFATILVGIATTSYLCFNIAPEGWGGWVMAFFGGMIPLLSARFLIKGKKGFFRLTAAVIIFADVSMVLSLTAGQAHVAEIRSMIDTQVPPELKRLQDASDKAQQTLDNLISQQRDAKTVAFVQILDGQIVDARADRDKAQAEERAWKPVESAAVKVNSHDVFMAVPTAVMSLDLSRLMTLAFAFIVAFIYQGTVVATVAATVKRAKSEARVGAQKVKRRRKVKPVDSTPHISQN